MLHGYLLGIVSKNFYRLLDSSRMVPEFPMPGHIGFDTMKFIKPTMYLWVWIPKLSLRSLTMLFEGSHANYLFKNHMEINLLIIIRPNKHKLPIADEAVNRKPLLLIAVFVCIRLVEPF
ncbi:hypothetical protein DMR_30040 [Solidesulfovibrio magneticus RS-1]|uniref:Uncharacterized protein n=1 Tax=Solidesulfovibrio magneticus (strain ATCC 700980 / DSM 13731 / RS-1) TaxID=573370 RepID=C4XHX7_SOLM1|nr:hypothetical protein DMR_30040 [Solidesulfovibrio magneticus RS-1]